MESVRITAEKPTLGPQHVEIPCRTVNRLDGAPFDHFSYRSSMVLIRDVMLCVIEGNHRKKVIAKPETPLFSKVHRIAKI